MITQSQYFEWWLFYNVVISVAVLPKDDVSANNHAPALHKTKTSTVHSGTYKGCIKVAIKTMKLKNSIDQESLQEQMKLLP